jgi:cyclopropane fatty-acyl-phospholipid synthase-like methyltransferase
LQAKVGGVIDIANARVIRAAQKFGARCGGVTLSQNQFDLATERVKVAGLEDRIEICRTVAA